MRSRSSVPFFPMHPTRILLLSLPLTLGALARAPADPSAPVAASAPGPAAAGSGRGVEEPPADTILWRSLGGPRPLDPPSGSALAPFPRLRLGLREHPLPFPLPRSLLPQPLPGGPLAPLDGWEVGGLRALDRHANPWAHYRLALGRRAARAEPADPRLALDPLPGAAAFFPVAVPEEEGMRGLVSDYADLGMRVQGRAELGGDWSRYRPCLDAFQQTCNPTLFPQLSPELRFAVQLGGTIDERVHIDVDFDQLREFEAANTINVFYQGESNEVVRRLEVGDVTFALPPSRFLTQGIPAGNFGFQATGRVGGLDLQAVWAEQRGDLSTRVFRLSGMGPDRGFVQEDTLVFDDADYVRGQFFFLVDPVELIDYTHLDVLSLNGSEASPLTAPGFEPVQLYRYENEPVVRQQVQGFIQADAVLEKDGERVEESGWFRYLQPGVDYFVHDSGLWIALRNPLRRDEMLAVTYVTAAGDTVGDYNPELLYNAGRRPELKLLKASAANHQPGRPTWELEMHQVYRVSGSPDVEPASVGVTISLGELSAGRTFKRHATGQAVTFLKLFGLDEEAPIDRVDPSFVYEPGQELFQAQAPVQGTFLVFPTLRPFAHPPPLRVQGITEEDGRELLGSDANPGIYDDPDPFERENGGRFRLTIPFRVQSEGVITSFSLGALGVRDASERIYVGERLLVRGVDYQIDYDVGQVTLTSPEALFAASPDAPVRASWEQKQIFQTAPTSVFGVSAHSDLGGAGVLDLVGLYQSEKTLAVRPALGLEPGAIAMGGLSGRLGGAALWMDRLLGSVPGLRAGGASAFTLDGEMALSLPNPNTKGDVFIDDFDATAERPLSLLSHHWTRGSRPASTEGAETALPPLLGVEDLAQLTWQHTWIVEGPSRDSVGIQEGFLPGQIDRQIQVTGSEIRDPGMLLTFGAPGAATGVPRWASLTTTLDPSGIDLTQSEFLEFYVAGGRALSLVVDLGEVSEDAFFVDAAGNTNGTKLHTGLPWGLGILDQEADPARGEIWGDLADQRGVWAELCAGSRGRIYRQGDALANCTRLNGLPDTEDLDGDGNLDEREKHLRWVVELAGGSPYLVRDTVETGTRFRLYRIPLQGPAARQVGGVFTDADLRAVKQLRVTLTGDRRQSATLTRLRIVGSRWIRRNQEGVLRGIVGDTLAGLGRVEVTPVSRITEGEAYQSPPGVIDQLADPSAGFGGQGIEINEKSLALVYEGIQPGDRTEVYQRFPQTPRNFLGYREARLWVLPREGDWGPERRHRFFLKIGTDPENFYLYRTPLRPTAGASTVIPEDWLPELVVDFEPWLELRRIAEERIALLPRGPNDPPVTVWSADSTYAVVLQGRGRGPDLANVRELAFGVWNEGGGPIRGEVWVDELRLGRGVRYAGLAGHLNLGFSAAEVLDTRLTFSSRGAYFRQLEESASYQTDRSLTLNSTLHLDRFAPEGWGVDLPLTLRHDRTDQDPVFLANSDVRANRLPGLRDTGGRQTRVSLGFRKVTPTAHPVLALLLDGLDANVGWFHAQSSTITSRYRSQGLDARLGYGRTLARRDFGIVPGFLEPVLRLLLPAFLEEPLMEARLRWSPERFSLGTSYFDNDNRIDHFDRIIRTASDSLVKPTLAPRQAVESSGQILLRPFGPLTADLTVLTTRDLISPELAVADPVVQRLLLHERRELAGMDLGWETHKTLRTRVGFRPRLLPWLRHDVDWTTSYLSDRSANLIGEASVPGGTAPALGRNAIGERNVRAVAAIDPPALARDLFGDPASVEPTPWGPLIPLLLVLRPLTFTWQDGITSRFLRETVSPGVGYQLGAGGLGDFRFVDGDTASTLTDQTVHRLDWGVAIPVGIGVDLAWTESDGATLDTRSDRTIRDETWPEVTARIESVTVPGPVRAVLERVSLAGGYRENRREVAFGGGDLQLRTITDREVPLDVTLAWAGATTTGYRGSWRVGEGRDPTGGTDRDRRSHSLSVSSSLAPPTLISDRIDRPLQVSLIVSYIAERECRASAGREDCVAFIDQLNRSAGLTLDTGVGDFQVGLQASVTDRQSFVGQHTGSTQFQLGLFGQFLFEAGALPMAPFD